MENQAKHFVDTVNPGRERTYDDFDPYCKWHSRGDTVEVHLDGFRKEHLNVRTSNMGFVTIHGERPLNEANRNTWSRFHKEIKLAEDCDPNEVSAKLAGGVLTVTMPRKAATVSNVVPKTTSSASPTPSEADHHPLLPPQIPTTSEKDDRPDINTTSSELIRRQRRSPLLSGFNVGKGVAVKLVVAVALVVALGVGAYLVKYYYKHGHCPPM